MKEYARLTFENDPLLTDDEFEQLAWAVGGPGHTPEKAFGVAEDKDYIEIRRCLSRVYCEKLLQDEAQYEKFIEPQTRDNPYCPTLKQEEFNQLVQKFKKLDPLAREVLKVSTIISSVSLRPKTRERADAVLGKNNYTLDGVEFLADTFKDIENAKKIYPLVEALFAKHPNESEQLRITKLLQAAFLSRCHYRHMLYTEGNRGMFVNLLDLIKNNQLDRETYDFWMAHWTINITGFRGQVKAKGSLYLTSNTFRAMQALESCLEKVWTEEVTLESILNEYLDIRAGEKFLDLKNIDSQDKKILAHLAAMMRLFHPAEGDALRQGYQLIPKTVIDALKAVYFDFPIELPTPTYSPALYENGLDYRQAKLGSESDILTHVEKNMDSEYIKQHARQLKRLIAIADVVVGVLPVNLKALKKYLELHSQGKVSNEQPLSFMKMANANEVMSLLKESPIFRKFNILKQHEPRVDENGTVSLVKKEKAEKDALPVQHLYNLRARSAKKLTPQAVSPKRKLQKSF